MLTFLLKNRYHTLFSLTGNNKMNKTFTKIKRKIKLSFCQIAVSGSAAQDAYLNSEKCVIRLQ